jgi:transmembrane sensor
MDNKLTPFGPDWDKVLEKLEANKAAGVELNPEEENLLKELQQIRTDAAQAFKAYNAFDTDKKWAELKQQLQPDHTNKNSNEEKATDKAMAQNLSSRSRNVYHCWDRTRAPKRQSTKT